MMRKFTWFVIILLAVLFFPIIPYENEIQQGVVQIEYRNVFGFLKERYEKVQAGGVGVVSSEMSEVPGKDVVPEGKHVQ